jgi:hypothetical protein
LLLVILGAHRSVEVFAGDVSWAESDRDALRDRTQAGVEVRVLCGRPSTQQQLDQVHALLSAGVKVKYYTNDLVKIRGLVVDVAVGLNGGTALTVEKTPKRRIHINPGHPGDDRLYNYEARRLLPGEDEGYIATLHQFFEAAWLALPPSHHVAQDEPE